MSTPNQIQPTEPSQSTAPRRTNPLSPLARSGQGLSAIAIAVLITGRDLPGGLPVRVLAFLGLLVLVVGIAGISWWRTTYWFDEDGDLRISSGLLYRNERRLQLSRLQSVELNRPFVARLIGLAEVRPEVAGGENAKLALAYLTEADAQALRAELLARSAGVRGTSTTAPIADERTLVRVPGKDLALSMLLNEQLILGVALATVIVVGAVFTGQFAGLVAILIAGGLPGLSLINGYLAYYDFTVAESGDGLRLRSGLLATKSQTVPPGRVQAASVEQPLLWRWKGWVRVKLNVAGSGGTDGDNDSRGGVLLLPVAPSEVAYGLLARVLPGVDLAAISLTEAPPQARRRAWFQFRQLAAGSDSQVFVARGGWLTRRLEVVPHARTQSVRITQGPWQRALGLATTHVDSTPGPVSPAAEQRGVADARQLAEAQAVLAGQARAAFRPEHWARPENPAGRENESKQE